MVPLTRRPGGLQAFKQCSRRVARRQPEQQVHEGYEWLYVLSGRLRLLLGEHDFVLAPARWPSSTPACRTASPTRTPSRRRCSASSVPRASGCTSAPARRLRRRRRGSRRARGPAGWRAASRRAPGRRRSGTAATKALRVIDSVYGHFAGLDFYEPDNAFIDAALRELLDRPRLSATLARHCAEARGRRGASSSPAASPDPRVQPRPTAPNPATRLPQTYTAA